MALGKEITGKIIFFQTNLCHTTSILFKVHQGRPQACAARAIEQGLQNSWAPKVSKYPKYI
jgi:hypothetical protein